MTNVKSLIIDDNKFSREEIKYMLGNYPGFEVIGEAANGMEGLTLTRERRPDVVFLDIEMPGLSGLEYADIVRRELPSPPKIVFVTAYPDFAVEGYDYQPITYLLKPIQEKRFSTAIEWIKNSMETSVEDKKLKIQGRDTIAFLDISRVIYISNINQTTIVHTTDAKYESTTRLNEYISRLQDYRFIRTHRNYLVNGNYKGDFQLTGNNSEGGYLVIRGCDDVIPVARGYFKQLKGDDDQ